MDFSNNPRERSKNYYYGKVRSKREQSLEQKNKRMLHNLYQEYWKQQWIPGTSKPKRPLWIDPWIEECRKADETSNDPFYPRVDMLQVKTGKQQNRPGEFMADNNRREIRDCSFESSVNLVSVKSNKNSQVEEDEKEGYDEELEEVDREDEYRGWDVDDKQQNEEQSNKLKETNVNILLTPMMKSDPTLGKNYWIIEGLDKEQGTDGLNFSENSLTTNKDDVTAINSDNEKLDKDKKLVNDNSVRLAQENAKLEVENSEIVGELNLSDTSIFGDFAEKNSKLLMTKSDTSACESRLSPHSFQSASSLVQSSMKTKNKKISSAASSNGFYNVWSRNDSATKKPTTSRPETLDELDRELFKGIRCRSWNRGEFCEVETQYTIRNRFMRTSSLDFTEAYNNEYDYNNNYFTERFCNISDAEFFINGGFQNTDQFCTVKLCEPLPPVQNKRDKSNNNCDGEYDFYSNRKQWEGMRCDGQRDSNQEQGKQTCLEICTENENAPHSTGNSFQSKISDDKIFDDLKVFLGRKKAKSLMSLMKLTDCRQES